MGKTIEKRHSYILKNIDPAFWEKVKLLAKVQNRKIKGTILQALDEMMKKNDL
ncbi:MAG: hypothetical protein ISS65_00535 [Desulfobacterales bacterium]|nr:hypothetical protein [Desulfobacterales bacterium]